MPDDLTTAVRGRLVPGEYVSVDVSQTKEKGVAICLLSTPAGGDVSIRYYHQPFPSTKPKKGEVVRMVGDWPPELLDACCYSIDSPLHYAKQEGGRQIDRKSVWTRLGFGDYLNVDPQQAPTEANALDDKKLWIKIGMWFHEVLVGLGKSVVEVYPTPSLNALHLWQSEGIRVTDWFGEEPGDYTVIAGDVAEVMPLRFLERLRASTNYGGTRTKFRKLSVWPYPDLWDAFGGAVTSLLFASGLTESISDDQDEGQIVVPMRLEKLVPSLG